MEEGSSPHRRVKCPEAIFRFFVAVDSYSDPYGQVTMQDEEYLRRALRLAKRGLGRVSPNPLVGAVLVKNDHVVGEGFHRKAGQPHAEVNAIREAGTESEGAVLYLNLEPCFHYGKTPPCVDLIIQKKIKRVVCSMEDPNPLVSGKSFSKLRQAGLEVDVGKLKKEAERLNEVYLKYITTGFPFVILKWAQTLDGQIATKTGDSKWISSEAPRRYLHRIRSQVDAILVGVETIIKDDPELSVRHLKGRSPLKIVLDSKLRVPPEAKVFGGEKLILATTPEAPQGRIEELGARGAEVWVLPPAADGLVDIAAVMKEVGKNQITSVLIEGGSKTLASALKAGIADKVIAFVAPKILGEGISAVGDLEVRQISGSFRLKDLQTRWCGGDLIYTGYL